MSYSIQSDACMIIDNIHNDFVHEFKIDETTTIPQLKKNKNGCKRRLAALLPCDIDERNQLNDKINEYSCAIRELKQKKQAYIMDNTKHLFDYFENKQTLSNTHVNDVISENNAGNKNINDFFKITTPECDNDPPSSFIKAKPQNFVRRYLSNVNKQVVSMESFTHDTSVCPHCGIDDDLMMIENEGIYICLSCAANVPCLIENEKSSYKEPPKEVSFYAYRKINHFKEIITQFQGKETTHIPNEVIVALRRQIARDRIPLSGLSYYKMKDLLKYLRFSKYYEHIAYIKAMLGIRPPNFSTEFEETLCNLFLEIQGPYAEVCPDSRVNFLGYYFVLYKLCEKCGQTQYLRDIPMLKDRDKIVSQDENWKKICAHPTLNWTFKHTSQEYVTRLAGDRTVMDMLMSK